MILKWVVSRPSTDHELHLLAHSEIGHYNLGGLSACPRPDPASGFHRRNQILANDSIDRKMLRQVLRACKTR